MPLAQDMGTATSTSAGPIPDSVDALVVGAGPAGAVTALLLARAGHDVVLMDREAFPRAKACGDCLSAGATHLLRRIGLLDRVRTADHAVLDGWRVVAPGGHVAEGRFGGATALAMDRAILDGLLVDGAREAGARMVTGRVEELVRDPASGQVRGVKARGPGGDALRIRAALVVGADGLRSVVARRLALVQRRPGLRKVSITAHVRVPSLRTRMGEMHVLDGGCIGFAPVGRDRFNVTLVVSGDRAAPLRELGPGGFMRRWLEQAPGLRERELDVPDHGLMASGPFDWPVRSPVRDGAALVGDAAGYYDPFTGQGIHHAIAGAILLADTVGPHLRSPELSAALTRYAHLHRRLSRPARFLQQLIETMLSRPGRADRVLRRLAAAPAAMDRLVEVTGDLRPVRSLLSTDLLLTLVRPPAPRTS
jgi:menaquinone-9 beta-reductase